MPTHVTKTCLAGGVLAASLVVSLGAGAAYADDAAPVEAQITGATLDPSQAIDGLRVGLEGDSPYQAKLFGLRLEDGTLLHTYCVELHTDVDASQDLEEVPWNQYPDPDSLFHQNRGYVNWILHHAYPELSPEDITTESGLTFVDGLTDEEALSATQAAIWHFTDGANLDESNPTPDVPEAAADVKTLYAYLTDDEVNTGIGDQPLPELAIDPASLSGEAGEMIGPFTVSTTADVATVSAMLPEGVSLVDADGNELPAEVASGIEIYVNVPEEAAAGAGSIVAEVVAQLSIGRLWIGANYDEFPTQSMILAASESKPMSVEAGVDWAAAPTPTPTPTETPTETPTPTEKPTPTPTETDEELPDTGSSDLGMPIGAGVALLLAGGALLARRRLIS